MKIKISDSELNTIMFCVEEAIINKKKELEELKIKKPEIYKTEEKIQKENIAVMNKLFESYKLGFENE